MGLVEYSSSSDEGCGDPQEPATKRRRVEKGNAGSLPALPETFRDLYAVAPRLSTRDDTSLHQGRKRTVPHVEGNWPTHIYLEWTPSHDQLSTLKALIEEVAGKSSSKVMSSLVSDVSTPLPLHISLSAPLVLRTEEREDFLSAVKVAIHSTLESKTEDAASQQAPELLKLRLGKLKWAANFERTRWFLAVGVERPEGDELNKLLNACNDIAAAKGLPTLYAKPNALDDDRGRSEDYSDRFHFSIAWTLEAPISGDTVMKLVDLPIAQASRLGDIEIPVHSVKVKMGNNIYSIILKQ